MWEPSKRAQRSSLKVAHLAEGAAAAHKESPQQKRQHIAELEERARLFGDSAKQSAQARVLERKWLRFLLVHGEEYSFTPRKGPTVALVEHFTTYCFCTRDTVSVIGIIIHHVDARTAPGASRMGIPVRTVHCTAKSGRNVMQTL